MKKNIYFFIGTTAELIKLAPVIKEFKKRKIDFKIIASAQNVLNFYELKTLIGKQRAYYTFKFKPMRLPKNIYLQFVIWAIKAFTNHILYFRNEFKGLDRKDSFFIVHGDTVSALLGAIIAKIYRIPLVHIESGLRSFNFFEPFPEELCRFIVASLADIHFCPNSWAVNNLKGVGGVKVNTGQNTLIESFWGIHYVNNHKNFKKKFNKYFVLVIHRQEHMLFKKGWTKTILQFVIKNTDQDLNCIFIIHHITKNFLKSTKINLDSQMKKRVKFIPRLQYIDFIKLLNGAELIVTDGGSNQEESYYLGKPCLILRNVTERIEGLGKNVVLSHGDENIILDFIKNYKKYEMDPIKFKTAPSKIIVDYLTLKS